MKNNFNKNANTFGGSGFAARAGSRANSLPSADRRGIILDETPRIPFPGVEELVRHILGSGYDSDIAQNKVPGWLNAPETTPPMRRASTRNSARVAAIESPVSQGFNSIREVADYFRRQALEDAARPIVTTPPFNPHAPTPADTQPVQPVFTSFRQLAEHLKRQVYDELSDVAGGDTDENAARNNYTPSEISRSYDAPEPDSDYGYASEYASQNHRSGITQADYRESMRHSPENIGQFDKPSYMLASSKNKKNKYDPMTPFKDAFPGFFTGKQQGDTCPDNSPASKEKNEWKASQDRKDFSLSPFKYLRAKNYATGHRAIVDKAAIEFNIPADLLFGIIIDEQYRKNLIDDISDGNRTEVASVGPLQIKIDTAKETYNDPVSGKLLRRIIPDLKNNEDFSKALYSETFSIYFAAAIIANTRKKWDTCVNGKNLSLVAAHSYHSPANHPKKYPVTDPRSHQIVNEFAMEYYDE